MNTTIKFLLIVSALLALCLSVHATTCRVSGQIYKSTDCSGDSVCIADEVTDGECRSTSSGSTLFHCSKSEGVLRFTTKNCTGESESIIGKCIASSSLSSRYNYGSCSSAAGLTSWLSILPSFFFF